MCFPKKTSHDLFDHDPESSILRGSWVMLEWKEMSEDPGNEGVMSRMETDGTLGHDGAPSPSAGSPPLERFLDTVRMLRRDF